MSPSSSGSQDSSWSPASISLVVMTCVVFLVCSYHMIFKRILETIPVRTPWRNGHSLSASTRLLEIPYPSSQQSQHSGLCTSILKTLPVTQYANEGEVKETECVVCLGEFNKGEWTRYLPDCGHRFHVACIDAWFQGHSSCPTCRARVGWRKTALETLSREAFVQERAMSYQDFRLQILHSMIIDIGTQTNFE